MMMPTQIKVLLRMSDDGITLMAFATEGASPTLPEGARWADPAQPGYWLRSPTDENIQAEIDKASVAWLPLTVTAWERCETPTPEDRSFRAAWSYNKGSFSHDIVKARTIHLDRLRGERTKVLKQLDMDWMRALGQKDQTGADAVEAKRQELRDMPVTLASAIDAAQDVEELKAIKLPE